MKCDDSSTGQEGDALCMDMQAVMFHTVLQVYKIYHGISF